MTLDVEKLGKILEKYEKKNLRIKIVYDKWGLTLEGSFMKGGKVYRANRLYSTMNLKYLPEGETIETVIDDFFGEVEKAVQNGRA